jgi:trigger factor
METKLTNRTETTAEFTVTLNETELKSTVTHVFDDLRPRVKASGFRPGKAPNQIVERELGSATIQSEVIDHAIQTSYSKAVRELDLPIVAQPEVTLDKFVPFTELSYKAVVELMPKVTLPEYKNYKMKRPVVTIDPAEVDQAVEELRRRESTRLAVERAAHDGDEVAFDFEGTKGGEPVRGATAKNHVLTIGSGNFIPGFEEELVGVKAGEEKSFDIRFPDAYHEESLAGEVVTFKIKMNKVDDLILPELNTEFVEKVSPFKTIEELRESLQANMADKHADEASKKFENELLEKLVADAKFEVPNALMAQQLDRLRGDLTQNLSYSGLDMEKYLEMLKKTQDELDEEMKPEARKRVGLAMVLTEVAAAEKIQLSAEDLDAEIAKMKEQYPDPQAQAELDSPATREELYNHLMASRVVAKLVEYAESK